MNRILTIAHNDIRLFLRDKSGYVWLFVVPFLFVFFFGSAGDNSDEDPANPRPYVLLDNKDTGFMGELMIAELDAQGLRVVAPGSEQEADVKRGIRFPTDFTDKIQARERVDIELFTVEGGSQQADKMIEVRLIRAIIAMTAGLASTDLAAKDETGPGTALEPVERETLESLLAREDMVPVNITFAGRKVTRSGFSQWLPGMLVMFLLMNMITFGGSSIADERRSRVIRRMGATPLTRFELVAGKIYGRFLLAVVQILFYFVLAGFVFKIPFTGNIMALGVLLVLYAWGCAALGVMLGGLILAEEKVILVGVLGANVLGGLGGCWFPLEIMPGYMRAIGSSIPTGWAMNGMHQLISFGAGWGAIRLELILLSGFALLITLLAARFLRFG